MTATFLDHEDAELGTVRLCRGCDETWPKDPEFWYFDRTGKVMGYCRACWSDRRGRPDFIFRAGPRAGRLRRG